MLQSNIHNHIISSMFSFFSDCSSWYSRSEDSEEFQLVFSAICPGWIAGTYVLLRILRIVCSLEVGNIKNRGLESASSFLAYSFGAFVEKSDPFSRVKLGLSTHPNLLQRIAYFESMYDILGVFSSPGRRWGLGRLNLFCF